MIKTVVKKILNHTVDSSKQDYILNLRILLINYISDLKLFYKHSMVFKVDSLFKIESEIILDYHSVEKGLLFEKMKPRFAYQRIMNLHKNLKKEIIIKNINFSQIKIGYQIMCSYYEIHKKLELDISDYFSEDDYLFYKSVLNEKYTKNFSGTIDYTKDKFYQSNDNNFESFSFSRKSIRSFTGEKIPFELIKEALKLASNAPSVCNRQSSKVYLLENKHTINNVLRIQGGFGGYTENVNQLLILTVDRNYFYSVGERNQMFIDGGIFLMNLLYALHFYRIANCPANWGKIIQEEKLLTEFINLPDSEKIICMIPIGIAEDNFRVTLSQRRGIDEFFRIIE